MEARIVRNSTPKTILLLMTIKVHSADKLQTNLYQRKGKMIMNHLLLLSDAST